MQIVAIIQARISSTRLPGKVLLDLEGKTVIEHVIERVKSSTFIDEVLVATSLNKEDLEIVKRCSILGIRVSCGSELDVLDRYYQAAKLIKPDIIVRITSDCPLIDPKVINDVIKLHLQKKVDYTSNTLPISYPDGEDVEAMSYTTLAKTWKEAKSFSEREHVTSYIRKHPKLFKLINLSYKKDLSAKRWTLDNEKDYIFIKTIYKHLYINNKIFGMNQILKFLKDHPEYEKINQIFKDTKFTKNP